MLKDQVLIPLISQTWASSGRLTCQPSQNLVDRCAQETCTSLAWGLVDRAVDRSESNALWF